MNAEKIYLNIPKEHEETALKMGAKYDKEKGLFFTEENDSMYLVILQFFKPLEDNENA